MVPGLSLYERPSKLQTLGMFFSGTLSYFATAYREYANRKKLEETTVFILDIQQLYHIG